MSSSGSRNSSGSREGFDIEYRLPEKRKHNKRTEKTGLVEWMSSIFTKKEHSKTRRKRTSSEERRKQRRSDMKRLRQHSRNRRHLLENKENMSKQIIESLRYGNMVDQEKEIIDAIEKGGNINYQDERGKTALIYAVSGYKPYPIIKFLIDLKADPNIVDNDGDTAYTIALRKYREPQRHKIITLFEEEGAFIPGQEIYLKG